MRHIHTTSQFVVYDDALPTAMHQGAWRQLQREEYTSIPPGMGVNRIDDGGPLRCNKSYLWTDCPEKLPPPGEWNARLVPSNEHYDPVLSHIAEIAIQHEDLLGVKRRDWLGIILTPHLYRRGDAVSWHTDGFTYTGAFAYYAHQHWNCLWGGEMLIVDERTPRDPKHFERKVLLDNAEENERLLSPGMGRFIMPKPNRLVFVGAGNEHMVAPVRPGAGNHVRGVYAGFLLKADRVDRIRAAPAM